MDAFSLGDRLNSSSLPPAIYKTVAVAALLWSAGAVATTTEVGAMAGSFSVTNSGAATYSIPIQVPPGIGGLAPRLSLGYNSGLGNGLAGYGWSLQGLSAISVCGTTWAQDGVNGNVGFTGTASDNNDYCLDGEKLMQTTSSSGVYRKEHDDFSRVTAYTTGGNGPAPTSGPQYFVLQTPDGMTYTYGQTADSEVIAVGSSVPSGVTMVRVWALNSISDKYGNSVDITYQQDTTNGDYWPLKITYTDHNGTAGPYKVVFKYTNLTSSNPGLVWSAYLGGAIESETRRLDEIDADDNGSPVFVYQLSYTNTLSDSNGNTGTERSELTSVQECVGTTCLPATTVGWQNGTSGWQTTSHAADNGSLPQGWTPHWGSIMLADLNGDGRIDIVYPVDTGSATEWFVMLSNGNGFESPVDSGLSSVEATYNQATLIDFQGNGQQELLLPIKNSSDNVDWFVATPLFNSDGTFSRFTINNGDTGRLAVGAGGNATVTDLNGDGLPDIVFSDSSDNMSWYENMGGSLSVKQVLAQGEFSFTNPNNQQLMGAVQRAAQFAGATPDFDGTGRGSLMVFSAVASGVPCNEDYCSPSQPPIPYWHIQEGGGVSSSDVAIAPVELGRTSGNPGNLAVPLFVDFNGDGISDMLYADGTATDGSNWTWRTYQSTGAGLTGADTGLAWNINFLSDDIAVDYSGNGREQVLIQITNGSGQCTSLGLVGYVAGVFQGGTSIGMSNQGPCAAAYVQGSLRTADIRGNGQHDLIWVAYNHIYYAFHNGAHPDLVTSINNNFNRNITINYAPLSDGAFYTPAAGGPAATQQYPGVGGRGHDVSAPETRNLNGPMYVVNNYSADDGVGGHYTLSESYSSGLIDVLGRGFLGFASTTATDVHNNVLINGVSGTVTDANTANYNQLFPITGMVLSSSVSVNGDTVSSSSHTWASIPTTLSSQYVYDSDAKNSRYTLGGSAYLTTETKTVPTISTNQHHLLNSLDTTSTTSPTSVSSETVTNFNTDTTNWCSVLPSSLTVTNTNANFPQGVIRSTAYTNDTVNCRNSTQTISVTDGSDNQSLETSYSYDPIYGNLTQTQVIATDNAGNNTYKTTYAYDATNTYVATITNPLGEISAASWNTDLGVKSSVTDPNQVSTNYTYDPFGLLSKVQAGDGTSVTFTYCLSANNCTPGAGAYSLTETHYSANQVAGAAVTTAFDTFYRPIHNSTYLIGGVLTNVDTAYDSLGRVVSSSLPYTGSPTTYNYTVYDLFNRPSAAYTPPGEGSTCTATLPPAFGGGTACAVSTAYDQNGGFTVATTDPMGKQSSVTLDSLGEIVSQTDAVGTVDSAGTQYQYDPFGDLTQITDAAGNQTTMNYDTLGRKLTMTDPNMGYWTYTYDPRGLLLTQTDPKSQQIIMSYDALGRILSRQRPLASGTGTDTWTYDGPNGVPTAPYIGNPYQEQGADGYQKQFQYDDLGRPDEVDTTINNVTYATNTSYDSFGRVGSVTYPATPLADADDPPVASASSNNPVTVSQTVTLDGSGSYDPDNGPQPLTYTWSQLDGPSPIAAVNGATTPNVSFITTVAGIYDFMLTASDGELINSASVSVTVLPATPAGLSASSVDPSTGNFSLSWNVATGATSYAVEQSTNGGVNYSMLPQTYTSVTAPLTGYANGTYTFGVQGCAADNSGNNDICGQFSSTTNVTVLRTPGVPSMNSITPNPSTTGNYAVNWSTPSGTITHYKLYSSTDGSTYDNGTNVGNVQSWSPSSAMVNGTYWYKVAACNSTCSNQSTAKSVTVSRPVPAAPTLNANPPTINSGSSSVLTWAPTGSVTATSYNLYQSLTGSFTGNPIYSGSLKTYTVSPTFSHYYAVAGCNSAGCGALSSAVKVTVNLGGQMMIQPTGTVTPTPAPGTTVSPAPATTDSGGVSALTPATVGIGLSSIVGGVTQRIAIAKEPTAVPVKVRLASLRGSAVAQLSRRMRREKAQAREADHVVEIRNVSSTVQNYAALREAADGSLVTSDLNLAELGPGRSAAQRAIHDSSVSADSVTRPIKTGTTERYTVNYVYDQYENLVQVVDAANTNFVYWQANSVNAFGQLTAETFGNNVITTRVYDSNTGALQGVDAGVGGGTGAMQQTYTWDDDGNLASRQDLNNGQTETFGYDNLNRLRQVNNAVTPALSVSLTYDTVGNIQTKSDVGSYFYSTTHPMQIDHITTTSGSRSFQYDNTGPNPGDGNLVSDGVHTYTWDSLNQLTQVVAAGTTQNIAYTPDGSRYYETTTGSVNTRLTEVNGLFQVYFDGTDTYDRETIMTPDGPTAIRSVTEQNILTTRYISTDHLGSTTAITNEAGAPDSFTSYDAFGQTRNPVNLQVYACGTAPSNATVTDKGYTGQQSMDPVCLVHMNGRVYDPQIGRFASADPTIPDPFYSQAFNRYAYVYNNPLNSIDPSGFADALPKFYLQGGPNFGQYIKGTYTEVAEVGDASNQFPKDGVEVPDGNIPPVQDPPAPYYTSEIGPSSFVPDAMPPTLSLSNAPAGLGTSLPSVGGPSIPAFGMDGTPDFATDCSGLTACSGGGGFDSVGSLGDIDWGSEGTGNPLPNANNTPHPSPQPMPHLPGGPSAAPSHGLSCTGPVSASCFNGASGGPGHSVIMTRSDGSIQLRTGGSRSWRNNNPGNIRSGDFAKRHGGIGTAGGMAVFQNPAAGRQALNGLLHTRTYTSLSVNKVISRFAPPSENPTQSYQSYILGKLGVSSDISEGSLTPGQFNTLEDAITRFEGWSQGSTLDLPELSLGP